MKIKFQADNDFDGRVIRALPRRNPMIDFRTAVAAGIHQARQMTACWKLPRMTGECLSRTI
jgi:hypothetical protein